MHVINGISFVIDALFTADLGIRHRLEAQLVHFLITLVVQMCISVSGTRVVVELIVEAVLNDLLVAGLFLRIHLRGLLVHQVSINTARIMVIYHLSRHADDLSKRLAEPKLLMVHERMVDLVLEVLQERRHLSADFFLLTIHAFFHEN